MHAFTSNRPPVSQRRFANAAVESLIGEVSADIADPEMAWLFSNCLPNTLDTTVDHRIGADGLPDTYVITGDIDAMWLRDSTAQVWPCLPLARGNETLRAMLVGVVRRQTRCVLLDPYANAFYRDPVFGHWQTDLTEMRPGVHERKWEIDSIAYFLRLSHGYWRATDDVDPFDEHWEDAIRVIFDLIRVEQSAGEGDLRSPYTFERPGGSCLPNSGYGLPSRNCGLVRCGFRPSDDMVRYPVLVPANAMLAVALSDVADMLETLRLDALATESSAISCEIMDALESHAVIHHPVHGEIWAYEVDGYGGAHLMDDANVPSLLSLPYVGFCTSDDPRYMRTRAFCLSADNPHFVDGKVGRGIGSPHTGVGTIWPMSLIMQALTATEDSEILACLAQLKATHAGTGFMHESFHCDDASNYTRPWFAWVNTLFGELILSLWRTRPHLLKCI